MDPTAHCNTFWQGIHVRLYSSDKTLFAAVTSQGQFCVVVSRQREENKSAAKPAEMKVKVPGICCGWEQIIPEDTGQWSRHQVCFGLWMSGRRKVSPSGAHKSEKVLAECQAGLWEAFRCVLLSQWHDVQNKASASWGACMSDSGASPLAVWWAARSPVQTNQLEPPWWN